MLDLTFNQKLGLGVKAFRKRAKKSQKEIGFVIGKSRTVVGRIESGARSMAPAELWFFCKLIDVRVDSVMVYWKEGKFNLW